MMKEKTTIEDLFAQYQPDMGDRNEYLEKLSKKLAAAEYAKQYREAQTRRYRRMMVAVFISGIVTGAIAMVLVLLHPQWLIPAGITIEAPAMFPLFPKVILLLIICFISVCITGLVRKISDSRHALLP
ncbi:MAG: hypothetical protein J6Z44_07585 [Bacteroidales bacterium]|nr:hypothetical protein [Bacteroidales bacterium]